MRTRKEFEPLPGIFFFYFLKFHFPLLKSISTFIIV